MSVLLFMDTERADRARKAKELESIFDAVVKEGVKLLNAERAALFMLDEEKQELWSQVATGTAGIIKVPADAGIVGACITSKELINIPDAYNDDRFNRNVDKDTGFHTRSLLVIPVFGAGGKPIAAIEMINKKNADGSSGEFGENDERLVKMLASHVTSFIRIVNGGDD
jgi:GAF domain-containing protein